MFYIKKLVFTLCLLYSVNIIIATSGKTIPINIYVIAFVYLFDFLGIIAIIYFKYYY